MLIAPGILSSTQSADRPNNPGRAYRRLGVVALFTEGWRPRLATAMPRLPRKRERPPASQRYRKSMARIHSSRLPNGEPGHDGYALNVKERFRHSAATAVRAASNWVSHRENCADACPRSSPARSADPHGRGPGTYAGDVFDGRNDRANDGNCKRNRKGCKYETRGHDASSLTRTISCSIDQRGLVPRDSLRESRRQRQQAR